jgi:hypothetical protein
MKQTLTKLVASLAVFIAAGCATGPAPGWGVRYEDRDKILEAATKIEATAVSLQELALRPESYLTTKNMYMVGSYDTTAADSVRFFATEAGRFVRAVRAWQPGGNIGLDYSSLVKQWNTMQNASGRLMTSEKMRVKLQSLNAMMIDLGRLASPVNAAAPVGAQSPAPAPR